jgi:hypothetical protein
MSSDTATDIRMALIAHIQLHTATSRRYDPRSERRLEALLRGEAVELPGWIVGVATRSPQYRRVPLVRVEVDGTVTPVEPSPGRSPSASRQPAAP